jgi:hypothetical protein
MSYKCERKGSLDVNIKNLIVNDFETLLSGYKNIDTLILTERKATDLKWTNKRHYVSGNAFYPKYYVV